MSQEKKIALVLSGGGAKGAFQFGAIKHMEESVKEKFPAFDYSIIAGVSVGALDAVMLAMGKYKELKDIWETITKERVYTGEINWTAFLKILFGAKSILSNRPLQDELKKQVRLKEVKTDKYDLRVGAVSLTTGQYKAFRPSDFDDDDEFRQAVLSSTAIPVIWPPVKKIKLKGPDFLESVDGGIRNVSPLGDVLDENPSEVVIINCSSTELPLAEDTHASDNILQIAKRSLSEIAIDEIFNSDLREFLTINHLVEQAEKQNCKLLKKDGTPYKAFRTILIQPTEDLGDTLDFSRDVINSRMKQGEAAAAKAFEGYLPLP